MRVLGYLAVGMVVGAALALALTHFDQIVGPSKRGLAVDVSTLDMSYTDFVTVMFTGATLVLAGVALVVALVAIFTYQGLKQEARRAVLDAAGEAKEQALKTLNAEVERQVATIDARIEKEVGIEAEDKIARVIQRAGRDGAFDEALQRALIAMGMGGVRLAEELEQDENGNR